MKKKQKISTCFAGSLGLLAICMFWGCAKVETTRVTTTSNVSSQTTIASDEVTVTDEFDQPVDEAIAIICNDSISILSVTVDPSQLGRGAIDINYSGVEANGTKSRVGNDSAHMSIIGGAPAWGSPGAIATLAFGDKYISSYEVAYLTNNTSVTFTGNATLTNVSGGLLQNLTPTDSLVVHIRANISFTFDDQAATILLFTWHIDQVRVFTKPDTIIYATTRGDTTIGGYSNVSTWGTTRLGNTFYTSITTAVVQNITNPYLSYNPMSGAKLIEGITQPILSTYGVNNQGNVVTGGTPYGFQIAWINNGVQTTAVVPYYY